MLICPVCDEALNEVGQTLRCERGHSYDVARDGYVDLMPAGHGASRKQGDAPEMLRARRRFLHHGHYDFLADHLATLCGAEHEQRDGATPFTALDVGCGEGYYIGRSREQLPLEADVQYYGLDVSKAALRLAARAHRGVRFFRNDVAQRICMAADSVDVLLNVFAPRNPLEFARIVRPGGLTLIVIPTLSHMRELRETMPLLRIDEDKEERIVAQLSVSFTLQDAVTLEQQTHLSGEDLSDLLAMTPNYWHLGDAPPQRALPSSTRTTLSFRILQFRS